MLARKNENKKQSDACEIYIKYTKVGAVLGAGSAVLLYLLVGSKDKEYLDFSYGMASPQLLLYLISGIEIPIYIPYSNTRDVFVAQYGRLYTQYQADMQQMCNIITKYNGADDLCERVKNNLYPSISMQKAASQATDGVMAQMKGYVSASGLAALIATAATLGATIGGALSTPHVCYVRHKNKSRPRELETKDLEAASSVVIPINETPIKRATSICSFLGVSRIGLFSAVLGGTAAAAAGSFVLAGAGLGFFTSKSVEILRDNCGSSRKVHRL